MPADAADQRRSQQVELQLAESGRDLAAALEAAQFARIIDHDPSVAPAEAAAIDGFADLFATAAERWDELGTAARAGLLGQLGAQLDALERRGWFVHWAVHGLGLADRRRRAVQLPLAILSVSRSGLPTLQVRIPGAVAIDPGANAVH